MKKIIPDEAHAAEHHHEDHESRAGLSERCGVSTTEKIGGSRCGSLSDAMAPNIGEYGRMARKSPSSKTRKRP